MRPAVLVLLASLAATAASVRAEPLSPAARERAVEALAAATDPAVRTQALPGLLAALADPVPAVRSAAARTLGAWEDPRAAVALAERLPLETDGRALAGMLLALGRCGSPGDATVVLVFARSHPVASVRTAAVTALGDLGGDAARRTVLALLVQPPRADPDWSFRAAALLALAVCGTADDVGPALVAYREGGGERHWFARAALARLVAARDRDPLPVLRPLVLDADPRVAVTAAVGIARLGHREEVVLGLKHARGGVRAAFASAVGREHLAAFYPRLETLARWDPERRVRWAAALALFAAEVACADELVIAALGAREPTVWAEALAALVGRTGENHGRDADAWRAALRRWREARR